jgi:hypothetical protein
METVFTPMSGSPRPLTYQHHCLWGRPSPLSGGTSGIITKKNLLFIHGILLHPLPTNMQVRTLPYMLRLL